MTCRRCGGDSKDCVFVCNSCGNKSKVTNICRPVPELMLEYGLTDDYKGHREAVNMVCITHNCEWCQ